MKILAIDKILPEATEEKIKVHLKEEALKAWELYNSGVFREMYFRTDRGGAVIIMECEDLAAAKKVVSDLPIVKAGLVDFDLIPLGPFLPLATLFEK
ncbi:MAG: superoxide dismutase [Cyanobacteria bacterium P01_G01_bin.19]